jgi:hypothetical protein
MVASARHLAALTDFNNKISRATCARVGRISAPAPQTANEVSASA